MLPPSTDEKGHSSTLTVRIPPNWVAQIDRIVKDHGTEYLNRGDFLRCAVYYYFGIAHAQRNDGRSNTAVLRALEGLLEEERVQQKGEKVLKKLHRMVEDYLKRGAHREALRLILVTLDGVKGMEEGYWRESFEKEIRDKYQGLLAGAKGVDILGKGVNEDGKDQ